MAEPKVGEPYHQEYYKGEAEDAGKVLAIDESVTGPTGSYDQVVKTEDTTPLEPDLVEHKWYAHGRGLRPGEVRQGRRREGHPREDHPARDGQGVSTILPVARRSSSVSSASAAASRPNVAPTGGSMAPDSMWGSRASHWPRT